MSVKLLILGYYCSHTDAIAAGLLGVVTPEVCPPGFYCPVKTKYAEEYPCDIGTYNPYEKKSKQKDCINCDAGNNILFKFKFVILILKKFM